MLGVVSMFSLSNDDIHCGCDAAERWGEGWRRGGGGARGAERG